MIQFDAQQALTAISQAATMGQTSVGTLQTTCTELVNIATQLNAEVAQVTTERDKAMAEAEQLNVFLIEARATAKPANARRSRGAAKKAPAKKS